MLAIGDTGLFAIHVECSRNQVLMKLTFRRRHRSIRELPMADLPSFTLVTGVNGAGKTHLLQGIQAGAIAVDVAPDHVNDVRYFDWSTLMPSDTAQMSTLQLYQERDQIIQQVT